MRRPTPTTQELAYVAAARRDDQAEAARLAALIDAAHEAKQAQFAAPGALLNSALWYATALGWPVFPCQPLGKAPATRHGFKDASTNPEQIRAWWRANPDYNVALVTGKHFDVFDIDGPQGVRAVGEYMDAGSFPDPLALTLTPRGRHLYVPAAGQGNSTNLLPKVDYRGAGGYVVAAPSRTRDGTYRWAAPPREESTGGPHDHRKHL